MLLQAMAVVAGLALLYAGAEWVVRGASRLARSVGVSALLVGLTVVSIGTSAPELVVSSLAAARQQGELVVGNVIGSNVVNIAMILGVAAMIAPLRVRLRLVQREIPVMIGLSALMMLLALNGAYGRVDGILLLVLLAGYIWYMIYAARHEPAIADRHLLEAGGRAADREAEAARAWRSAGILFAGFAGLLLGAHLLVSSALFFAQEIGVSEVVIGITLVALGTSLPELATSVVAALRSETEIAVGNAVGSNIFNILLVLGTAASIRPLSVPGELLRFEFPVMLAVAVVILPLALAGRRYQLGRVEGVLLLAGYLLFTGVLVARAVAGWTLPAY